MQTQMQHNELSDSDLVDRYLETQNTQYFDLLYSRYADRIFGKCMGLLKNENAAQDATQEIFVKILLNLAKFNKASRLSTWIYSITYNYCIDFIRRRKKQPLLFEAEYETQIPDDKPEISDAELLDIRVDRLKIVLDKVRQEDKFILLMKYQDRMSINDIGSALSMSDSAVKMRLKRAKQKVKDMHSKMFTEEI